MMTTNAISWWVCLSTVAMFNIVVWLFSVARFRKQGMPLPREVHTLRRWQLALSAIYVFGCAFRSFFPVYDVPRICMVDSWLSSVFVGRSIATIAELSFVAQWALMLRHVARTTTNKFATVTSSLLVPMILVAETCSWYSVLTTANIGHVIEESLWGICAATVVVSLLAMRPRCSEQMRRVIDLSCVLGIVYVAFMFFVDVPMYWSRWIADQSIKREYLTLAQGFFDTSHRWTVSYSWHYWRHEVPWMTLYFSVAVWFSISLAHAPTLHFGEIKRQRRLQSALA